MGVEEQPGDLDAGHPPVHDDQVVVAELGDQRGQHALEAEAAAEIRVIDVVPLRLAAIMRSTMGAVALQS